MYGVIGSTTKKIKKLYGSISSKTRKIKKVYGVVGGVTKLIWKSGTDVTYPLQWIVDGEINTSCQFPLPSTNNGNSNNGIYYTGKLIFPMVDGCFDYMKNRTLTVVYDYSMYNMLQDTGMYYRWLYGPVSANGYLSGLTETFYINYYNPNLYLENECFLYSRAMYIRTVTLS